MFNFKYLVGGAALALATSALAGGPEPVPAAPAPADNSGFYINANGGLNLRSDFSGNDWNKWGWNAGAAVGYHFNNNLRVEVAGNYWRHAVRSNIQQFVDFIGVRAPAFQMTTLMGNVYYDFDFGSSFVPYIGAGLGWAHQWIGQTTFQGVQLSASRSQNQFAIQGIVGLDYKITDHVRIGLNYHLMGFAGKNNDWNHPNQIRFSNNVENQFNLGLSYYF